MKQDNNINHTVQEVKNVFSDYFAIIGGKKFKQFYYDWHVDNMLSPFSGLVAYFDKYYGPQGAKKFHEFVKDMRARIKIYNADKPQLSVLKNSDFSKDKTGELSELIDGMETFGFEFRQFMYNFADREDHDNAFRGWPVKPNMPYSAQYGMMVAADMLSFLDKNYTSLTSEGDVSVRAAYAADVFLRKTLAGKYCYHDEYDFNFRRQTMQKLLDLKGRLKTEFANISETNEAWRNMFQIETPGTVVEQKYWPCGFELEFYVPEKYRDYDRLIEYLKSQNEWSKLYSSNKDASVYHDENSAGVIMRDESLVRYNKLAAVEYASRIMKNKEDEESCLKILDAFNEGHVNVHCSLHQHLAADGLDLAAYKRLVKRMMQHEEKIVSAFAAPERRDNKLLYATYISRNLSRDGRGDYPFLCLMVDLCDDKRQLQEFASFGHKYKTLNIMPEHTVEMRFMNANFNKKFVKAFLEFNREFVRSAAENSPVHVNRILLNKYSWHNNRQTDTKTVIHRLPYAYDYEYDSFHPRERQVSKNVIEQEQKCWRLIMHALNETGKVAYVNAAFNKKIVEAKGYGK